MPAPPSAGRTTRYVDAWVQYQTWEADPDRFTVETPPDPGHGDISEPSQAVVMQDAPVLQGGGDIMTDAVFEVVDHLPASMRIDETIVGHGVPRTGHDAPPGGSSRPYSAEERYGRDVMGSQRGADAGADKRATVQVGRPWRFFDDQYGSTTSEGADDTPLSNMTGAPILVRGLNAYNANDGSGGRTRQLTVQAPGASKDIPVSSWRVNSPSWKAGVYTSSNVQRGAFHPPRRTHREPRYGLPNVVTLVGDAPPPTKPDKYASPFSSMQRFGLNTARTRVPASRRIPGPWDEAIVVENTDKAVPDSASADGWVVP